MRSNVDTSQTPTPSLPQAFRQGVEAATRGDDRNPYTPDSRLHHAWTAGWAAVAKGWADLDQPWRGQDAAKENTAWREP